MPLTFAKGLDTELDEAIIEMLKKGGPTSQYSIVIRVGYKIKPEVAMSCFTFGNDGLERFPTLADRIEKGKSVFISFLLDKLRHKGKICYDREQKKWMLPGPRKTK